MHTNTIFGGVAPLRKASGTHDNTRSNMVAHAEQLKLARRAASQEREMRNNMH